MMDYSSFSTLNFSVGKLLAGRYEIVRQLRADETSIELLVRDKVADDQLALLKLYSTGDAAKSCIENGEIDPERRRTLVGTKDSGFYFEAAALHDSAFEFDVKFQPGSTGHSSGNFHSAIGASFERHSRPKVERPKPSPLGRLQAVLKLKNSLRAKSGASS